MKMLILMYLEHNYEHWCSKYIVTNLTALTSIIPMCRRRKSIATKHTPKGGTKPWFNHMWWCWVMAEQLRRSMGNTTAVVMRKRDFGSPSICSATMNYGYFFVAPGEACNGKKRVTSTQQQYQQLRTATNSAENVSCQWWWFLLENVSCQWWWFLL